MTTDSKLETTDLCPEQVPAIVENKIENEVVLYDPRTDAAHVLNPTAAMVWWLCDGQHSIRAIADEIGNLFEEKSPDLLTDITQVVKQFIVAGVVRWK